MAGALVTTNILKTAVAMGLKALRERLAMARIVNRDYEKEITGVSRGSTVNVSVPAAITTRNVTADVVPPSVPAVTPTIVAIVVDQWKEAPFAMDDKGLAQVDRGIVPMQLSEAVKSIANTIDNYLWGLYTAFYGYVGVAATTPFATDLSEALSAIQLADEQLMPMDEDDTFLLLNPAAKANALGLRAIQDASWRANQQGIVRGERDEVGEILNQRQVVGQENALRAAIVQIHHAEDLTTVANG